MSLEKAGKLSIINFTQILVTYGFDVVYMGRKSTWPDVVGSLLIVGFTLVTNLVAIFSSETEVSKAAKEKNLEMLTPGEEPGSTSTGSNFHDEEKEKLLGKSS